MAPKHGFASAEELLGHAGWLRALAASLVGEGPAADGLAQDAWLAALRKPPRRGRPLRPWLASVTRNLARNRQRGESRRAVREADADPGRREPSPDELIEELDAQRALVEAVRALPEPERATVVLRYLRGWNASEISRHQGVPAGTVRWRLSRALEQLRAELDARFDGSRGAWSVLLLPYALGPSAAGPVIAGALGAPALVQGVVMMNVFAKLAVVLSIVAVAGFFWMDAGDGAARTDVGPVVASSLEAPDPGRVEAGAAPQHERAPGLAGTAAESPAEPIAEPAGAAPPALSTAIVRARFVDPGGTPIPGVVLSAVDGRRVEGEASDADGALELRVHSPLRASSEWLQELVATRAGFATTVHAAALSPGEEVWLGELELVPGSVLYGRVTDLAGAPLADAQVEVRAAELDSRDPELLHRLGPSSSEHGALARSDADGRFELVGVAPGDWRVFGKSPETRHGWTDPIRVEVGIDRYDVQLALEPWRREDRILGAVLDPQGEPVPHAQVTWSYQSERQRGSSGVTADAEGRFEVVVPVNGTYSFEARHPTRDLGQGSQGDVRPGDHDVVLRLSAEVLVEVVARDAEGAAVERYAVGWRDARGGLSMRGAVEERPGGRAQLAIPPHAFDVLVEAPGYAEATAGPYSSDSPPALVELELERVGQLRGVVLANGQPVAGARIRAYGAKPGFRVRYNGFPSRMQGSHETETRSADDGRFVLDSPGAGDWYLRASAPGRATAELGPIALGAAAPPDDLEVVLPAAGAIEGRVLFSDGRDTTGVIVGLHRGDVEPRSQRAGPGGRFRFEDLTPGSYELLRLEHELDPHTTRTSVGPELEIEWSCEVFEGRTTRFDLE